MPAFPRIHLAIDNCFAAKRWTRPAEWSREAAALGVRCIEASADTELDPLFLGRDYLDRWVAELLDVQERSGTRVVNLYSGHGTYATLGLAHTDPRVAERFLDQWLKPMVDTAGAIGAGLGFFFHAFPLATLADAARFRAAWDTLVERLAVLSAYNAATAAPAVIGLEQMYTPHQVPWTIAQTRALLAAVWRRSGAPFYTTIDLGHQSAQRRYLRPTRAELTAVAAALTAGKEPPAIWLGLEPPLPGAAPAGNAGTVHGVVERLEHYIAANEHLFARAEDGDPYAWLRALAGWSPIIHLQQTDGTSSAHLPFTERHNAHGIIDGAAVLQAIGDHYRAATSEPTMPPRVADIYLTIEVFSSTAEKPDEIRAKLRASAAYWRRYVPQDGLPLDELV